MKIRNNVLKLQFKRRVQLILATELLHHNISHLNLHILNIMVSKGKGKEYFFTKIVFFYNFYCYKKVKLCNILSDFKRFNDSFRKVCLICTACTALQILSIILKYCTFILYKINEIKGHLSDLKRCFNDSFLTHSSTLKNKLA